MAGKRANESERPRGLRNKAKKAAKVVVPEVFARGLLQMTSRSELRTQHDTNGPYTHAVIDDLCKGSVMRQVHEEAKAHFKVDFKETDLFKVYQSGELANMPADTEGAEHLMALRTALYSSEFRDFVGHIMDCPDLTDRVDCSANAYTQGCHLLCHDDVIGTRRVSYIIYLTDPDEGWAAEDGGSLELYPLTDTTQKSGMPAAAPSKTIIPAFNRMALFKVQPGRSYHSVQEVFADKPRLSISGWFHGRTPPEGSEGASLQQLLAHQGAKDEPFRTLPPPTPTAAPTDSKQEASLGDFSDAELKQLRRWINPVYLTDESMGQVRKKFCKDSHIRLFDFLHDDVVSGVQQRMEGDDAADGLGAGKAALDYGAGLVDEWGCVGPPHMQRHLVYRVDHAPSSSSSSLASPSSSPSDSVTATALPPTAAGMGPLLGQVYTTLMDQPTFARYLTELTAVTPISRRGGVRRFRPGLDYTVAHRSLTADKKYLDASLCFVNVRDDEVQAATRGRSADEMDDDDLWESGDAGGFECYIEQDPEDAEAAEVYTKEKDSDDDGEGEGDEGGGGGGGQDDGGVLLSVTPGTNVLSLVMRDEDTLRFVKYVSAKAPSSRWDVSVAYELSPDDFQDSDEEDDDDDDDDDDDEPELPFVMRK